MLHLHRVRKTAAPNVPLRPASRLLHLDSACTRRARHDLLGSRGRVSSQSTTAHPCGLGGTLRVPGPRIYLAGVERSSLLQTGPLSQSEFDRIRTRWREVADASWEGQV